MNGLPAVKQTLRHARFRFNLRRCGKESLSIYETNSQALDASLWVKRARESA